MAEAKPETKSSVGKYVICFQMVGKQKKPFEAQIVGEPNGQYWLVKIGRGKKEYKVHKGSCSTVPFRKEESGTPAYREKVFAKIGADGSDREDAAPSGSPAPVRKPKGKRAAPAKKPISLGRK